MTGTSPETDADPADARAAAPEPGPAPRRTRSGAVRIGPSILARYRPGALIGLPLVALLLCPLGAAGLQQWRWGTLAEHGPTALTDLLAHDLVVFPIAALLIWALLALWAFVPLVATTPQVVLDERRGVLVRRRGLRPREERPLSSVVWAVGEGERDAIALIGFARPGTGGVDDVSDADAGTGPDAGAVDPVGLESPDVHGDPGEPVGSADVERWVVPYIGWDDRSFEGLRVLQTAAGLRPSPPRRELVQEARRQRQVRARREMAERVAMPWRPEYEHDAAAFGRDHDHARRVLGGKEPQDPPPAARP